MTKLYLARTREIESVRGTPAIAKAPFRGIFGHFSGGFRGVSDKTLNPTKLGANLCEPLKLKG